MPRKLTTKLFIEKATHIHSGKYDYSEVKYTKSSEKVKILCPDHGYFSQVANSHLRGIGCPNCARSKTTGTKYFKDKVKEVYGDRFNLDLVEYCGQREPVKIICKKHGCFEVKPENFISRKSGCPECKKEEKRESVGKAFIQKATEIHNGRYSYDSVEYYNMATKVTITCPIHGYFVQTPLAHTQEHGCPHCANDKKYNTHEDFIEKANKLHKGKYDYTYVSYKKLSVPIEIICKKHNLLFSQKPSHHLRGKGGCPRCKEENNRSTTEEFTDKAISVHGDLYDYTRSNFVTYKAPIEIICKKHNESFWQEPNNHVQGKGCPKCRGIVSKTEDTVASFIKGMGLTLILSNRQIIKPLELDIVIPEKNLAIEYNGLRWHSEKFGKDKHYHKNKTDLCKEQGYRLLHIWEDDFNNNPERELNFIKYSLGLYDNEKVYARKTTIKEIPNKLGREFLDKHHIQGSGSGSVYFGLYYQDNLVAVTSFLRKKDCVELTRHCADRQVIGGLGKITKYSSKYFQQDILSFCDLARFDGKSYLACGYEIDKVLPPDYKYVVGEERQHKFLWRKKHIKTKLPDVYNENLTEKEMMELADIPRIWDCGKLRLIYKFK